MSDDHKDMRKWFNSFRWASLGRRLNKACIRYTGEASSYLHVTARVTPQYSAQGELTGLWTSKLTVVVGTKTYNYQLPREPGASYEKVYDAAMACEDTLVNLMDSLEDTAAIRAVDRMWSPDGTPAENMNEPLWDAMPPPSLGTNPCGEVEVAPSVVCMLPPSAPVERCTLCGHEKPRHYSACEHNPEAKSSRITGLGWDQPKPIVVFCQNEEDVP